MPSFENPRLLADVGGTYARFALEAAPGRFTHIVSLRCAEYPDFHAAVQAYLALLRPIKPALHAAVAIANPVDGDWVRMTNYHWQFSIEQMRERLGLETLVVVNDFTALAMAVPRLAPGDRRQVGGGEPHKRSVIGLLGSGSGLGVSGLIPVDGGWVSLGSEGGHSSLSPCDDNEVTILRYAWRTHSHVSFERLLSGAGLELMYRALAIQAGRPETPLPALEISHRALDGSDAVCVQTVDVFCAILGTAASNLALTLGALGGIYIGGQIVPRLGEVFDRSRFRERFEDKGRFRDYLAAIPTYVITAENTTFAGASAILIAQLDRRRTEAGGSLLDQIRRERATLSRAERRVAEHVLAVPRSALNDPIAEIARGANVSQPTVIRFCRSLGCEGLSDFKRRLASSLSGTVPITHSQVKDSDSALDMGAKVLDNTASAILAMRERLTRDTIDRAIDLLASCARVEIYALGHYGIVGQDAVIKFLRFGLPASAHVEPRVRTLSANALSERDVVLVVSNSGRQPELIRLAQRARERGAAVVAIAPAHSPLARLASVAISLDPVEDVATQLPMISRIQYLLVVDVLAVGVAMRHKAIGPGDLSHRRVDPGEDGGAAGIDGPVEHETDIDAGADSGEPSMLAHLDLPSRR